MERWKHCEHPNQHKHVACNDGDWVRHDEAQAEIARLTSELAQAREWIAAEAEARGDQDEAYPVDRRCAAILARIDQRKEAGA